jgi:hypothetical protein
LTDWSESPNVTEETYNAVQWGKKLERKRIIALLEGHIKEAQYRAPSQTSLFYFAQEITNAIALIKGAEE